MVCARSHTRPACRSCAGSPVGLSRSGGFVFAVGVGRSAMSAPRRLYPTHERNEMTATSALRGSCVVAVAMLASVLVPAVAVARPSYTVRTLPRLGAEPVRGRLPGPAFDDTHITGQELEPSITVNPRTRATSWRRGSRTSGRAATAPTSPPPRSTAAGPGRATRSPVSRSARAATADGASDPWVTAGGGGTVYFAGLQPSRWASRRSALRGRRQPLVRRRAYLGAPATVASRHQGVETPAITGSPKRAGTAYTVWADFAFAERILSSRVRPTTASRGRRPWWSTSPARPRSTCLRGWSSCRTGRW